MKYESSNVTSSYSVSMFLPLEAEDFPAVVNSNAGLFALACHYLNSCTAAASASLTLTLAVAVLHVEVSDSLKTLLAARRAVPVLRNRFIAAGAVVNWLNDSGFRWHDSKATAPP
jgi:hypothetical protein